MRKNYIDGDWMGADAAIAVEHPYDGLAYDEVPSASMEDVDRAINAAVKAVDHAKRMGVYKRYDAMLKAANLLEARVEEFAQALTAESGKPLAEARGEASRCVDLIRLCAFEGPQLRGEQLPYESAFNGAGKMGMTLRVPCGVVVAITPFNFPLLLALHKIGPALATGNAVILKPASVTPITSLMITEIFLEAGFDGNTLQVITGTGTTVGMGLAADLRPRKVSFTGSSQVGLKLAEVAGLKRLSLELGSNCPMVVMPDADLDVVAQQVAVGGYANAGQVCLSLQRVIVDQQVYGDFLDAASAAVKKIKVGPPREEGTVLASMIEEKEACRVQDWIHEACDAGAKVITGGGREKAVHEATLIADATAGMRLVGDEVFGPVVAAMPAANIDEAVAMANDSDFGLSAAIFTSDVTNALRFARDAEAGNVHINWSPQWRADFMPYGGFKRSGIGKEGVRSTCMEMTEEKSIVFHGLPPH